MGALITGADYWFIPEDPHIDGWEIDMCSNIAEVRFLLFCFQHRICVCLFLGKFEWTLVFFSLLLLLFFFFLLKREGKLESAARLLFWLREPLMRMESPLQARTLLTCWKRTAGALASPS
jgi:hypothetical protein